MVIVDKAVPHLLRSPQVSRGTHSTHAVPTHLKQFSCSKTAQLVGV